MIVYEVPKGDRADFCQRFTTQHGGEPLRIEIWPAGAREPQGRGARTFRGLDYDAERDVLDVHIAQQATPQTFDVEGVEALRMLQPEDEGGYLEARTRHGDHLRLRFDQVLIPGFLDGVTNAERQT